MANHLLQKMRFLNCMIEQITFVHPSTNESSNRICLLIYLLSLFLSRGPICTYQIPSLSLRPAPSPPPTKKTLNRPPPFLQYSYLMTCLWRDIAAEAHIDIQVGHQCLSLLHQQGLFPPDGCPYVQRIAAPSLNDCYMKQGYVYLSTLRMV